MCISAIVAAVALSAGTVISGNISASKQAKATMQAAKQAEKQATEQAEQTQRQAETQIAQERAAEQAKAAIAAQQQSTVVQVGENLPASSDMAQQKRRKAFQSSGAGLKI